MKKMTASPKAIIVRESPRHFQSATSSHDLNWAIGVLSQYDHHIFVSSSCRDEWSAFVPLCNIPNDYIPNCCEEERARKILETDKLEVRKSLGMPSDRFIIMCVGSLQPRKGQNLVIEKLASIVQVIPHALVYFVGSDPLGWKQDLEKQVEVANLGQHVRFVPSQPSALEWIYAADVLLLPSKAEAMPRVVLEAMVLKTPVVAAQVDGVSELVEHTSSGWLFSHEKIEDMVKGLLAATSLKNSGVVQAASTAYWEKFSRAKLVKRFCLTFDKIKKIH
jgi:glycosyltransferase involved in cell wall biosynthesis